MNIPKVPESTSSWPQAACSLCILLPVVVFKLSPSRWVGGFALNLKLKTQETRSAYAQHPNPKLLNPKGPKHLRPKS